MKRLLLTLCLAVLSAPLLPADTALTPEEIARAKAYLEKTRAGVLAATANLSPAQWNFKPAPERWSVAEVTEHIAAAEDMLQGLIKGKVMSAPPRKDPTEAKAVDAFVLTAIPDRSHKQKAPEPLVPTNRFKTPEDSLKHFEASRAETIAYLENTSGLRDHAIPAEFGKTLDGYEWILFIAAHSERHTKQILEVKADPNFPKQ